MNRLVPYTLATMSVLSTTLALADDPVVVNTNPQSRAAAATIDFSRLKPMVNKLPPPKTASIVAETGPGPYQAGVMTKQGIVWDSGTRAYGSHGIPYTTTRVSDGTYSATGYSAASRMSVTFPYRAAGKLTVDGSHCSATLIRRSVIVTAAHCIQDFGTGSNTFTDFKFIPGHYGPAGATAAQRAPHGIWDWATFTRPGSWMDGTDIGDGAARQNDIAVIVLQKQGNTFVGDVVGWLGYSFNNYSFVSSSKTGNLLTGAVTSLGYPGVIDGGNIMQRTDGPTYTTTVSGAAQYWQGSNFGGGASGGAWIVNMRTRAASLNGGAVAGTASNLAVIGVTSWGSADPNVPKDNYSSRFGQNSRYPSANYGIYGAGNIGSLLNTVCSKAAPGGGTYASQGYCD